jgi:hypothetical protein
LMLEWRVLAETDSLAGLSHSLVEYVIRERVVLRENGRFGGLAGSVVEYVIIIFFYKNEL